jgi:hypothetical protein
MIDVSAVFVSLLHDYLHKAMEGQEGNVYPSVCYMKREWTTKQR